MNLISGRTLGADVAHLGLLVNRLEPACFDAVEPALAVELVLVVEAGRAVVVEELDGAAAAEEEDSEEEDEGEEGREDDDERDHDGERLHERETEVGYDEDEVSLPQGDKPATALPVDVRGLVSVLCPVHRALAVVRVEERLRRRSGPRASRAILRRAGPVPARPVRPQPRARAHRRAR